MFGVDWSGRIRFHVSGFVWLVLMRKWDVAIFILTATVLVIARRVAYMFNVVGEVDGASSDMDHVVGEASWFGRVIFTHLSQTYVD